MDKSTRVPTLPVEFVKQGTHTTGPGNRINHAISVYNKKMIVIGGIPTLTAHNSDEHFKTIHCYNFDSKNWHKKEHQLSAKEAADKNQD